MSAAAITVYIPCHPYGRFLEQAVRWLIEQILRRRNAKEAALE